MTALAFLRDPAAMSTLDAQIAAQGDAKGNHTATRVTRRIGLGIGHRRDDV
jgi:hypothetical protein